MDKKQENNMFSNAWKKAAEFGKKAADETKKFANQTKANIHEQKAKKYTAVTDKEYKAKDFCVPQIVIIEEDTANREFVEEENAIGWIEVHKEAPALHMYSSFVKKCGITFIPSAQVKNVYCRDNFDAKKYVDANLVFGRATEEKLAELNHIAYSLGAKRCSIEILEEDGTSELMQAQLQLAKTQPTKISSSSHTRKSQSGKMVTDFVAHDSPKMPTLKWYAHDTNITNLIEMRCNKAIKSNVLELCGSATATMSKSLACSLDAIIGVKGGLSMEKQSQKEHNTRLVFEVEFL